MHVNTMLGILTLSTHFYSQVAYQLFPDIYRAAGYRQSDLKVTYLSLSFEPQYLFSLNIKFLVLYAYIQKVTPKGYILHMLH